MSDGVKTAMRFLIGCIGVAIVVFAFWGGAALLAHNGSSQTCSRHGGHWVATDEPFGSGVERSRECQP